MEGGAVEENEVEQERCQPFMTTEMESGERITMPRIEVHLELVYEEDNVTRAGVRFWFDVLDPRMDLDRFIDNCIELHRRRMAKAKGRTLQRPAPWDMAAACITSRAAYVALV